MKATFDIPDELYRQVKARSALEGRPLRSVAVQLFQGWLKAPALPQTEVPPEGGDLTAEDYERFPWLKISRKYIKPGMNHDWADMKASIAKAWGDEVAKKLNLQKPES